MKDLSWLVYVENVNRKTIEEYNIFKHGGFCKECEQWLEECSDIISFAEKLRMSLMYYFWSKCEYEIVLAGWPCPEYTDGRKVDVYQQVMLNYTPFVEYIWKNCKGDI